MKKMIKVLTVCVTLIFMMAFTHSLDAPSIPVASSQACDISNTTFQGGEELTYKLYYNWNFMWLSAGEVTFKVTEEGSFYHVNAKGSTYASYEWFFKVRDNYDSYINKETMLPNVAVRDIKEGGYVLYDKVNFDQVKRKASSLRGPSAAKATRKEFLVDECMHDVLSVIYYTRNLDYKNMKKGDAFPVKIFLDQEVYPLSVKYEGAEKHNIKGLGTYNTIKFSPQVVEGQVFKKGSQMQVWATNDGNRIPLLIESPVSVGSIKAVLKSHKGLRYDLSSKVGK